MASTLVLYSFVIALGVFLGKIKVGSVSLGVTFVLFVGIIMGHLGYIVNPEVLKFIREFGLILFIFAIGIQVGPGFFSSFKKGGVRLNMLAVAAIALNVIIVLVIYFIEDGHTTMPALVGVMSGAVTNTPGLAAAQQAVGDNVEAINTMSMGYAAAYPLGVCGIIGAMFLIKAIFRIRIDNEIKAIEEENEKLHTKPNFVSIEVTNHLINGKSLRELHDIVQCDFVISRLMDQ
ncbi:MAG: transporter, partial [Paramuribaculum sp.]|nr:transporter [Paramuribaculum sp.]